MHRRRRGAVPGAGAQRLSAGGPAAAAVVPRRLRGRAAARSRPTSQGIVAVVGWPQSAGSVVYNAASVLRDGAVETTYRKRELPNYAVFDERRYFDVDPDGGACVFEVNGVRRRRADLRGPVVPRAAGARPCAAGAQLVLVPNASPFERDKHAQRDALLAQRVRETGAWRACAYLNVVGGQDALVFDGASVLADGDGIVHPAARAFDGALAGGRFRRGSRASSRRCSGRSRATKAATRWPGARSCAAPATTAARTASTKAWLGLSGGIDSSVVLAIAVDALGADNVTAVRMPSRYTAGLSNDLAAGAMRRAGRAAAGVADREAVPGLPRRAGARCSPASAADTTEENLQSRTRGALLMALSNKFGGLLLTTGNKSEYAVGYATIYGDMCGGYAPIKDLYKTEVFALCALAQHGRRCAGDPAGGDRAAAVGGTARQPERPGFAAALRRARRDPAAPRRPGAVARRRSSRPASMPRSSTGCCGWCGSASGSATSPRRGRRCRGARSGASGAIRSATGTSSGRRSAPWARCCLRAGSTRHRAQERSYKQKRRLAAAFCLRVQSLISSRCPARTSRRRTG